MCHHTPFTVLSQQYNLLLTTTSPDRDSQEALGIIPQIAGYKLGWERYCSGHSEALFLRHCMCRILQHLSTCAFLLLNLWHMLINKVKFDCILQMYMDCDQEGECKNALLLSATCTFCPMVANIHYFHPCFCMPGSTPLKNRIER